MQLDPFEGVEESEYLGVVEFAPTGDVPAEEHDGELDAFLVAETDLPSEDEQLAALRAHGGTTTLHDDDRIDGDWFDRARCVPDRARFDPESEIDPSVRRHRSLWWRVYRKSPDVPPGVSFKAMRNAALIICRICPVQWECVRNAIELDDRYLIWAASETDREVLASRDNWSELIDEAQQTGTSVQVMIANLKGNQP